jgi:hypothetical protein
MLGGGYSVGGALAVTSASTIKDLEGSGMAIGYDAPLKVGLGEGLLGVGPKGNLTSAGGVVGVGLGPVLDVHAFSTTTKVVPLFTSCYPSSGQTCPSPYPKRVPAPGPVTPTTPKPTGTLGPRRS